MAAIATSAEDCRRASAETIADYASVAEGYAASSMTHDVSQNIDALRSPRDRLAPRWAVQQARSGRSSSI